MADLDANMKIVHLETWFEYDPAPCLAIVCHVYVQERLIVCLSCSPQRLFGQIAPNGVTKLPDATTSYTSVGVEDDSSKREYGTHPEDPKPESPLEGGSSTIEQVSQESLDRSIFERGTSSLSLTGEERECPFLRSSGPG